MKGPFFIRRLTELQICGLGSCQQMLNIIEVQVQIFLNNSIIEKC